MKACERCAHFCISKRGSPFERLECRANPPYLHNGVGVFPTVEKNSWCSKFKEKSSMTTKPTPRR